MVFGSTVTIALALLLACFVQDGAADPTYATKVSSIVGLSCTNVCLDAQNAGLSYKNCFRALDQSGLTVGCSTTPTAASVPVTCLCKNPTSSTFLTSPDGTILTTVTPKGNSGSSSSSSSTNSQCSGIHRACSSCSRRRLPGTSKTAMVCTACAAGWRLRPDGLAQTCDCAPGFYLNGTLTAYNSWCNACKRPQFCKGGDATLNPNSVASDCQSGLGTVMDGARSELQCTTLAGFGRSSELSADGSAVITTVEECPVGTYNIGGNTAPCSICPSGLTTVAPGATNITQCVAPPGSYLYLGVGKLCPQGTYQPDYNTMTFCHSCPTGLTTEGEGHNSSTDCTLAMKGYYIVNGSAAAPCPVGTYSDQEGAVTQCTACPYGYQTQSTGTQGLAMCFAPPGYELASGAEHITQCPQDWYKEGWNRNPCVQCGTGLITAGTGSVNIDDCVVPAGFGIVSLDPMVAEMCIESTYGMNLTRPAITSSRCEFCPPDMYTMDVLTGVNATAGYTSYNNCMVKPGYGVTTGGLVQICETGTYNSGYNQEPCKACPAGFTTDPDQEGATSDLDCRVIPGWVISQKLGIPQPCDKGTYSPGGTVDNPHPNECIQCPAGFTTQTDESTAPEDCSYCVAGHGGANCTICPYDTYSTGGGEVGQACSQCPQYLVSARGAIEGDHCTPDMVTAETDYMPLSDESAWTAQSSAATQDACKQACRANAKCAMHRFAADPAATGDKCYLLLEVTGGVKTWGFKVSSFDDYSLYQFGSGLTAGVLTASVGTVTAKQCRDACSKTSKCEMFVIQTASVTDASATTTCELYGSVLDSDWLSVHHIQGNRLYSDVLLPDAQFPSQPSALASLGRKVMLFA